MKMIDKLSECEDKLLDPRKLSFRLKKPLRRRINDLLSSDGRDSKLGITLKGILDREEDHKNLLTYEDVSEMHQTLQRLDATYSLFFHQLLDECRAFITDERENKELNDRLKKLQFDFGNKSYKEMTKAITSRSSAGIDVASEVRQLRPILITLLNSVLVIGGTFLFVFKAVEYSMTKPDVAVQVMAGLIAAIIVAIAELYFLAKII